MVHALREEPGSYTRTLENGAEVIYAIRPLNGGYIAEWEYVAGSGPEEQPTRSHKEEFRTHADALCRSQLTNHSELRFRALLSGGTYDVRFERVASG